MARVCCCRVSDCVADVSVRLSARDKCDTSQCTYAGRYTRHHSRCWLRQQRRDVCLARGRSGDYVPVGFEHPDHSHHARCERGHGVIVINTTSTGGGASSSFNYLNRVCLLFKGFVFNGCLVRMQPECYDRCSIRRSAGAVRSHLSGQRLGFNTADITFVTLFGVPATAVTWQSVSRILVVTDPHTAAGTGPVVVMTNIYGTGGGGNYTYNNRTVALLCSYTCLYQKANIFCVRVLFFC